MVQIIEENRKPSFGQRLSQGVGRGLEMGSQLMQAHQQEQKQAQQFQQENQAVQQLIGKDISGVRDPKMRQAFVEMALQAQQQQQKYDFESQLAETQSGRKTQEEQSKILQEKQEKLLPLESALENVQQMKSIRKKGNLGTGTKLWANFGGETAKDKGTYETLGNSLIQFASNIKISNKNEFEKLAGHLSDPEITDKEAEGILNTLEKIITDNMKGLKDEDQETEENKVLDSAAMQKIYELAKGDKNEAKRIAKKMGYKV